MRIHTPADIARLIKTERLDQQLTQEQVSAPLGITRQTLTRIERGEGGVAFETLLKVLAHLGISLEASAQSATASVKGRSPDAEPSETKNLPRTSAQLAAEIARERVDLSGAARRALTSNDIARRLEGIRLRAWGLPGTPGDAGENCD